MSTIDTIRINGINYNIGGGSGTGLTDNIKSALDQLSQKVAYIDNNGQNYYDALHSALYPPANLSYITCVYTQSGVVYDTASLDSLKSDLVVTAHYDNGTTQTVTTYTLSGTLTEGTSTITVAYGGKTTTFNVTVSTFSTAPRIAEYDKVIHSDGQTKDKTGACYTEGYDYQVDVNALKSHNYYDSSNNYMTISGSIFKIKIALTNPDDISFGGHGKHVFSDTSNSVIDYASPNWSGNETLMTDTRYISGFLTLSNNTLRMRFTLTTNGIDNSYAYFTDTATHIMPIGVRDGDIIFAGRNTPYYGKTNIND